MAETKKKNKKKKATISEEDISLLLQRYSAAVIVKLLQEVAQLPDAKFDWNEVVKKTSTGITNAREYQMIWRHLAYRDTLLENVDEGMEPLDDDSDLETDLEAFPPVSAEASVEAAAFAKVLIGTRLPSNSGPLNRPTVEGPLTINIPIGQSSTVASDNPQPLEKNIIVPVVVPKEKDGGGSKTCPAKAKKKEDEDKDKDPIGATGTNKRKRKQWTEQEDMELIAAVQKCGERNWANILKGDFKGDRTASQLSQRWAILRKKQAHLGGAGPNSQLTEAQLATRRAVSHALNMPMVDNLLAACSVGATQSSIPSSSAAVPCGPEETSVGAQTQQASRNKGIPTPSSKPKVTAVKGPTVPFKPLSGSDPMIQAAAVAAGARIATPSTAASLLKAAQSKNVVHFRPGACSMVKTPLPGATKPSPTNHLGSRPKVHYIRTGLAPASAPPTYSSPSPSIPHPGSSQLEPGNSTKRQTVTGSLPLSTASSTVVLPSSSTTALCGAEGTKMTEDMKSEEIKEDGSGNASEEFENGQVDPKSEMRTETETTVENLKQSTIVDAGENKQLVDDSKQAESSDAVNTEACTTAITEEKAEACTTAMDEEKTEACTTAMAEEKTEACTTAMDEEKTEACTTAMAEEKTEACTTAMDED